MKRLKRSLKLKKSKTVLLDPRLIITGQVVMMSQKYSLRHLTEYKKPLVTSVLISTNFQSLKERRNRIKLLKKLNLRKLRMNLLFSLI